MVVFTFCSSHKQWCIRSNVIANSDKTADPKNKNLNFHSCPFTGQTVSVIGGNTLVMCVYIHDEMCSLTCIVKNGDGEGSCGCCKSVGRSK